eukprot:233194-Hanusia_phi.AAC.2
MACALLMGRGPAGWQRHHGMRHAHQSDVHGISGVTQCHDASGVYGRRTGRSPPPPGMHCGERRAAVRTAEGPPCTVGVWPGPGWSPGRPGQLLLPP